MTSKLSKLLQTPGSEILGKLFGICRRSTVVELQEALDRKEQTIQHLMNDMHKMHKKHQQDILTVESKVVIKYVMPAETFSKLKQKISPAIVSTTSTDLQAAFIVGQRSVLDEVEKLWVS